MYCLILCLFVLVTTSVHSLDEDEIVLPDYYIEMDRYTNQRPCISLDSVLEDNQSKDVECIIFSNKRDMSIKIGTNIITCHRAVLALAIPYFDVSTSSLQSKVAALESQQFDPSTLESVILFAYTHLLYLNPPNVTELLRVAQFLEMQDLVATTIDYIGRKSPQSVIHILNHSDDLSMRREAEDYVKEHFAEVSASDEFLQLNVKDLLSILRSNAIKVNSEEVVFEAASRWLDYAPQNRSALRFDIMENVRFTKLSLTYIIDNVLGGHMDQFHGEYRNLLEDAITNLLKNSSRDSIQGCALPRETGPSRIITVKYAFQRSAMHWFDPIANQTQKFGDGPNKMMFTLVVDNCRIYAIGGLRDGILTSTVHVFNPKTSLWDSTAPLETPRYWSAATAHNAIIYVSGGRRDGNIFLKSLEALNPTNNHWTSMASMTGPRASHAFVTVGDDLYALGGQTSHSILSSVEKYDISSNQWTAAPAMLDARMDFGATVLHGKIYVCGGRGNTGSLVSAEVFDPVVQSWTRIASMHEKRHGFSLVAYIGKLYAIPGFVSSSVERYDPETNVWEIFSSNNEFGWIHAAVINA